MSKFMMLVGVSGCGKSTVANALANDSTIIYSSDAIREELWGNAEDQQHPGVVFDEMNKRTIASLKSGIDVIYDATNLSAKRRASLLRHIERNVPGTSLECHLVVAEPQRCLDNQLLRERQVPEYAVRRQLTSFQLPTMAEGWTEPIYVHNPFYREGLLDELTQAMIGVSQKGPWHQETVDAHNTLVVSHAQAMGYAPIVVEMAKYHDIGKPFTRTVDEDGKTHFFGHANVGAYAYLCAMAPTGVLSNDVWYRAMMIAHHMDFMGNVNHERLQEELGSKLYNDLMQLHHADEFGAVRAEHTQMHVLDFMNTFYDWELRLKLSPFCCNIKRDGEYTLLQYQQLNSDFSSRVVQECRGSIFRKDSCANWTYVCRPFDKFFNYGQAEAVDVDWNTARVLEKVDGCFSGEDCVMMSDGSKLPFKTIHTKLKRGEPLSVLTYNLETGLVEPKRILSIKRTECQHPESEWLTIRYKRMMSTLATPSAKMSQHCVTTVTRNHMMYVRSADGAIIEKPAEELLVGDHILGVTAGLTMIERQVILGGLLGDASCTYVRTKDATLHKGYRFLHTDKQDEYAQYKYNLLKRLGGELYRYTTQYSYGQNKVRYISKTNPAITSIYDFVYHDGQKRVTRHCLEQLDWLGFAIWYMDDGSRHTGCKNNSIHLHTEGYSPDEVQIISDYYNDIGYKNYIHHYKTYHIINFSTAASDMIWAHIRTFIPDCMQYKLPERHRGFYTPIVDEYACGMELYDGFVADIKPGFHAHKNFGYEEKWKFDIEVEDNHNYFCQGALVHNSLMKVWYRDCEWHLSTNGNIDAFKAPVSDLGYSYGDVFNRALGQDFSLLGLWLDPEYTYMFELTSPDTQLVVPYPDGVWYLSRRHTQTGVEQFDRPNLPGVKLPKEFHMDKFEDVLAVVQAMPKEEEGVVINDAHGNRIKVKSPEYLMAAHLSNNKMVSNRNLVEYMKENKLDDFLAYCPQYLPRVQVLLDKFNTKCEQLESAWAEVEPSSSLSRKEFAAIVSKNAHKGYLFYKLEHPESNASEYLLNQTTPTLMRALGLKTDELGYLPKGEQALNKEEQDER